ARVRRVPIDGGRPDPRQYGPSADSAAPARARVAAPGRPHQHPLRRAYRAEQEDRGSHPSCRALQALRRCVLPLHLRGPAGRVAALLHGDPGTRCRVPHAARAIPVPRPGVGGRAGRLLSQRARLRLAERARGLLRAARRSHDDGRARARVRRGRRGRDDGRRGHHVLTEGSRTGGRMARRADLRPSPAGIRGRRTTAAGPRVRTNRRRAPAPAYAGDRYTVRIAFIVQRYGAEILGGSEYSCRLIAERLAQRHQVDVVTTCARDYLTWANEYPEGPDRLRGVTVRRFAVSKTRDLTTFNRLSDRIFHESHSAQDELEWLKQQGPWSPGLIDYLERHHQHYDVLVFFTYLYAPTVIGIKIAPAKSILVPTAHDEHAIRLEMYRDVFSSAAGIVWNTDAERRFVQSRFRLRA